MVLGLVATKGDAIFGGNVSFSEYGVGGGLLLPLPTVFFPVQHFFNCLS